MVDLPRLSLSSQPDVCEEISYKVPNPIEGAAYTLNGKSIDPGQSVALTFSDTPYIVSASFANACGTQILGDTFTVGHPQAVKILTFPNDTVICVSPTALVLKANIAGGTWSTAGIQTQNGQKVFIPSTPGEYAISYSNGVGKCFSQHTVKVRVDGPQASAVDQTICAGTSSIKLVATPAGGSWSTSSCQNCLKGDTLLTAAVTATQVDLIYSISNSNGCRAIATAKVTMGRPKADFTLSGGCVGANFQPKNNSSGAGNYTWLVNGAVVSSDASPQLRLTQGLQRVTLIARSGDCSDTLHRDVKIMAAPGPVSFTPSIMMGCSPLAVALNVNGIVSPDASYTWDLGNGSTFTGFQPPAQVFENSEKQNKTFKVIFNAQNTCGTQTDSKDIVVRPKARAEIGVDSTTLRCAPAQMLFSNRSSGHDKSETKWFFGDGTQRQTGSDTVYHTFAAGNDVRTYRVRLEVNSACGQDTTSVEIKVYPTTVKALFTISKSVVCPGEEVKFIDASVPKPTKWIWKFGDGSVATVANPVHLYSQPQKNYTVTLIAYTACGFDSTQLVVKTTDALAGSFAEIPLACEGSEVSFVNKSDSRLGFVWDFGDSSPLDSANYSPDHVYAKTGNYTASLSVYRDTQACKTVVQRAVVSVVPGVIADFGFTADSVFCAPGPVTIVNRSQNADTFWWAFSDGRTYNAKNPALPFDPGMYGAKLVASKGGFCKDSVERAAAIMVEYCKVDIPTAFTPNGDGYGERYTLFGTGIQRIERLLIRDRWGEIVFQMKDVPPSSQQSGESWDGTFKGKPLPADMYVYEAVIRYSDNRVSEKLRGNLYLIRK
jgi:gliding motility-associated-like protein